MKWSEIFTSCFIWDPHLRHSLVWPPSWWVFFPCATSPFHVYRYFTYIQGLKRKNLYKQLILKYFCSAGKLLSHVQSDSDPTRQSAVKKRIAQYIFRAEQLGKEVFHFYFSSFLFNNYSHWLKQCCRSGTLKIRSLIRNISFWTHNTGIRNRYQCVLYAF